MLRNILRSLYRELYGEEAVDDVDQVRVDKYMSELRDTLLKYGCELADSALRDMVIMYIKHIDALGSENKAWLLYFVWVFSIDDKIEKFDRELLLNTSFENILNHGLHQEKQIYEDIVEELPRELRNPFKYGVRQWYNGVRLYMYEYADHSTSTISMYLTRFMSVGFTPTLIAALAFKNCRLDMVDDTEFIRIMNAQTEFIMMVNDIASYQRESNAHDVFVTTDENIPAIVVQLKNIEKTIEVINTKYVGHPVMQMNKIFLWWHCVAGRYDPKVKKNFY
ncbi:hypothetical protein BGZ89_006080 [Linnemannia elongata]|nr:hypothetical protein BGZ89_006080 [Linnemannia elongata]